VSVKQVGPHTGVGPLRERVAARRNSRNIGSVAAARRQVLPVASFDDGGVIVGDDGLG
jgi:hypothetical protein